ncbi:MAG: tRNA lysidine(34) synthetase TilS [Acidobacteria bacterium]|nr:MAG: tRNA lysidine(34) synthetase TilS [Acidobacteriota bacterium]
MTKARKTKQTRAKSKSPLLGRGLATFARGLLQEWRNLGLPSESATIIVAVSGGADSTALLLALDELIRAKKLKIKLVVAHLNHKLRAAASDADARWVRSLAKESGHRAIVGTRKVKALASKTSDNLEQTARRARYEFLTRIARSNKTNLVLTAHTMNDQAETVLLNLMRGTGGDGLSGIERVRPLTSGSGIMLARPLLSWARRSDTEDYCRQRAIDYRSDEMNADESFARVRVRKQLLPLMERFNPRFIQSIARSAEILREDNLALEAAAARLLELSLQPREKRRGNSLRIDLLRVAPIALRRRALRLWLAQHRGDLIRIERVHIAAIENLLASTAGARRRDNLNRLFPKTRIDERGTEPVALATGSSLRLPACWRKRFRTRSPNSTHDY